MEEANHQTLGDPRIILGKVGMDERWGFCAIYELFVAFLEFAIFLINGAEGGRTDNEETD
jgi:hypothetical protein